MKISNQNKTYTILNVIIRTTYGSGVYSDLDILALKHIRADLVNNYLQALSKHMYKRGIGVILGKTKITVTINI